jgi:hypothetical protein
LRAITLNLNPTRTRSIDARIRAEISSMLAFVTGVRRASRGARKEEAW